MTRGKNKEIAVGLFAAAGIIVLASMTILFSDFNFLKKTYTLFIDFKIVNGLIEGAPVRYAGVEVGRVQRLILMKEKNRCRVRVECSLEQGTSVSPKDKAVITSIGIMGDKYVEIIPDQQCLECLASSSVMQGETPVLLSELLEQGKNVLNNFSVTLDKVIDADSRTALRSIIMNLDELTGKKTQDKLNAILDNFMKMSGEQTRARYNSIMDSVEETIVLFKEKMAKIEAARLNNILAAIDQNLAQTGPQVSQALERFNNALSGLDALLKQIQSGQGTVHSLVYDSALHDELLDLVRKLKKHGIFYKGRKDKALDEGGNRGFVNR